MTTGIVDSLFNFLLEIMLKYEGSGNRDNVRGGGGILPIPILGVLSVNPNQIRQRPR